MVREQLKTSANRYIQNDKETLTHLLKLGAADAFARGQTINLDTDEEFSRLVPILCAYFSREELIELVGEKTTSDIFDMHHQMVLQNLVIESELQRCLAAFKQAEIPLILFKGPALSYTIYPEAHLRTYHDIDALIHPEDLPRAHELLKRMGYTFYEEFRASAIANQRTGYNYILGRSNSQLQVLIELHTAPHPSEIGTHFASNALRERARSIVVLGEPTLTLDPIDHLLYLCWHYRFHAFTRLIWLYDLVVMLRAIEPELDWMLLVHQAQRQSLATTLYYCLSWCRDLFGVTVPEQVFARLRPPLACRLIIERIVLPEGANALAATSRKARRIVAHRAMVDSKTSLLKAGFRALFPSRATIGLRYMNYSRLPLQFYSLYYLIHPWITLARACRYLLISGRERTIL